MKISFYYYRGKQINSMLDLIFDILKYSFLYVISDIEMKELKRLQI